MDNKGKGKVQGGFSSRWGLVLTMIGACVGTGNVWKFPRMVTLHGQGSFILAWTIILFAISIPVLLVEMVMGRATRHGAAGAFKDFIGEKYTWMGAFMAGTTVLITAYYTVIMGWCVRYMYYSIKGFGQYNLAGLDQLFQNASNGWVNVLIFIALLILTAIVVMKDISSGIEKVGKVMTPALYIILIVLFIRVITLPNASSGLQFMFEVSPKTFFSVDTWIAALNQSAWSVGPGFGLVIAMAVYTKAKSDVAMNTFMQGLGDNSAALLAGFVVVPGLFALAPSVEAATELAATGNYGLTFISFTQLFASLPGGSVLSFLFFLGLFFAAFTANIIFYLTGVVPLMDTGMSKKKACGYVFVPTLFLGVFSAYNITFLDNQDLVWGMALLIGATFTCFAAVKFGVEKIRTKYINIPENDLPIGKWWNVCISVIAPVMIVGLFAWTVYEGIAGDSNWWNPLNPSSVGTYLFQIGILLALVLAFNRKMNKSIRNNYIDTAEVYPEIPQEHLA